MQNPLNDRPFLKLLDEQRYKEPYARITLLTFDEQPIEYIQGKVTGGFINFDGASSVRRTCNLSIVSANQDINLYYLGLERKFILEIGLNNEINKNYPDIIWFPMGIYVTSNFSTSRNTNSYSISIQGKDKTCLLNGDISGNLPSSINFGELEEVSEDGMTITRTKVKVRDIIFNLIETYGNEMPHNIVINDVEETGLELLEYRGDKPVYLFLSRPESETTTYEIQCSNLTLDGNYLVYYQDKEDNEYKPISLKNIKKEEFINLNDISNNSASIFYSKEEKGQRQKLKIGKIEYGGLIGYRETDLVYAGDLIANVNDTVTSVLDKIKNMLGDFEYFYDTNGRFIFQKKKVLYEYDAWQPKVVGQDDNTKYYDNNKIETNIFYNFEDNELITSINNTPNLLNAKNDYSIWGVRKTSTGGEIPIHLRYAIEQKPQYYKTYLPTFKNGKKDDDKNYEQWIYKIGEDGSYEINPEEKVITCDWREILYQMAADYHKYKDLNDDFFAQVRDNNNVNNDYLYPTGKTGYELYYTDILGFWRDIFSPEMENGKVYFYKQVILTESLYKRNYYYTKDAIEDGVYNRFPKYTLCEDYNYNDNKIYYERTSFTKETNRTHFHPDVEDNPSLLNFWIDFLDTTGELSKYSTKTIGQRSKCVNDNKVTSIYYRPVPNLIFQNSNLEGVGSNRRTSYTYINSNENLDKCFVVASQGKNAWEEAQSYLNSYARCVEQISFNAIPIYYMIPNVRVALKDEQSKMNGEYVIDKLNFNLSYNGTMSVTATKIFDNIY